MTKEITLIDTNEIVAGNNDRTTFDQAQLQELADSIGQQGLIQPISVRFLDGCDLYQIIAGERRYRACKMAGLDQIPAIILDIGDEEASILMLTENVARADLDPIDEANAYASRIAQFRWTVKECAQRAGVSDVRVRFRLKLLRLRDNLQKLVRDGQLTIGYAQILADGKLDANRQMIAIARLRSNPSPTPTWFRRQVGQLLEEQAQESIFDTDLFTARAIAEQEMTFTEPPHPNTTTPPIKGKSPRERILSLVEFWQKAAGQWNALGKPFKRQECQAAAQALSFALSTL